MPFSNTVYVLSTWAFCLCIREMRGIVWVGRHLLFFNARRRFFKRAIHAVGKVLSREMKDYNKFTYICNSVDIHGVCREFGWGYINDQSANRSSRKMSKEVEFAIWHNEVQDVHTKRQTMKVTLKMSKLYCYELRQSSDRRSYMRTKFWIWADFPSTSN